VNGTEQQIIEMRTKLMERFTCPECGGSGYVLHVTFGKEVIVECQHRTLRRLSQQVLTMPPVALA
jgi:hypothetical protein